MSGTEATGKVGQYTVSDMSVCVCVCVNNKFRGRRTGDPMSLCKGEVNK